MILRLTGEADNIVMIAFDLLYLNGRDLRKVPLRERKGTPQEADRRHSYPI